MPRIGVYTTKGVNMEKEGVTPDVVVDAPPDELAKGIDAQLEKAVEVLSVDVVEWKKSKAGIASAPTPPTTPSPTVPAAAGMTPKP